MPSAQKSEAEKFRAEKLAAPLEDYMDGPTELNSDDPRLLDYIRTYFFLKPEHYEVRESNEAEFMQPLRNKCLIVLRQFLKIRNRESQFILPISEMRNCESGKKNMPL